MLETLKKALKTKEIRKRIVYTLLMVVVVRLGCEIPIPFINYSEIETVMSNNLASDAFNFFSAITGGSMETMSIFALNISPYITASIIMQLLTIAIPKLDEIQKDGEEGRRKIAEITRYVTVALAIIESTAMVIGFSNTGIFRSVKGIKEGYVIVIGIIAMTAGSTLLMWLGERITEKGVGNGISIILTINIISSLPNTIVSNLFVPYVFGSGINPAKRILGAAVIIGVIVGIVVLVVLLQGATRKIAVQMSQKVQGRKLVGGQQSNIPLKVNTAGVIPVIFASSLLQFPIVIASFLQKQPGWLNYLNQSKWCDPNQLKYSIGFVVYLLLIVFFAYFYTSITFNPREVAKNLNDRGGFIPGIRSGKPTVAYLTKILNYIILIGAVGLIIVSVIPIIASGVSGAEIGFGGTSVIIIVGVIIETLETIKSMVSERSYSTVKGIF